MSVYDQINLKSGMNVLQWRTIGALSDMMHTSVSPVLIRKIEITGQYYVLGVASVKIEITGQYMSLVLII